MVRNELDILDTHRCDLDYRVIHHAVSQRISERIEEMMTDLGELQKRVKAMGGKLEEDCTDDYAIDMLTIELPAFGKVWLWVDLDGEDLISAALDGLEAKSKARKLVKKYRQEVTSMQASLSIPTQIQIKINERLGFIEALRSEFGIEEDK